MYAASPEGVPIGGAAAQRRLLALLAILATGGRAGVSRDRVLALLWPDGDPDKSRHALTQALYHARRALGSDDLIDASGGDLRLDDALVTSDVEQLEEAARRGDHRRVAELYQGPFLDGFFLSGSAEFERWASEQRQRIARIAADSLEALAAAAESRQEYAEAAAWRRRQVALDPLDARATVLLLDALAASGDRTGALQHARVHESLVRQELDVAPDPRVTHAVVRIRRELAEGSSPLQASPVAPPPVAPSPVAPSPVAPSPVAPSPVAQSPVAQSPVAESPAAESPVTEPPTPPGPSHRRLAFAATLLVLAALAGISAWQRRPGTAVSPTLDQPVVVAPFRVAGASAELAFLRDGMVELLSTRLADDSSDKAVDPATVLRAWRAAGFGTLADVPRDSAVDAAARLGAGHLVLGSVVGTPSRMVLSAALIDVGTRRMVAEGTADGPSDSLTSLVDRLAVRLLAGEAGEGDRLDARLTPSVRALRAYLEGRSAEEQGEYLAAARAFERAVDQDSTFTLAAFHLALASDRLNNAEQHDRGLALAWTGREALTARDEAHLLAFAGPRYPAPSPAVEQLAAWERAVALAPDRADVWIELGERFYFDGALLGVDSADVRAARAFSRALELAPHSARARRYLVLLAARANDLATLDRIATPLALRDSMGALAPYARWRVAIVRRDEAALQQLRAALPRTDDANLRAIGMSAQHDLGDARMHADAERALRIRTLRAQRPRDLMDALLAEHSLALNLGRVVQALDVTEQLEALQPGTRAHLRLRVLDALYGGGDTAAARAAAERLAREVDGTPQSLARARAIQLADACVVGQWRLARGEAAGAERVVAQLRKAAAPRDAVPVGTAPAACAELLDAQLAVTTRRRDALERVQRVDSLVLGGPAVGDAVAWAPLLVARMYERLGRRDAALAAVRRRPYMSGWPRYMAATLEAERRLLRDAGR